MEILKVFKYPAMAKCDKITILTKNSLLDIKYTMGFVDQFCLNGVTICFRLLWKHFD